MASTADTVRKRYLAKLVRERGQDWVDEHRTMLDAQWAYAVDPFFTEEEQELDLDHGSGRGQEPDDAQVKALKVRLEADGALDADWIKMNLESYYADQQAHVEAMKMENARRAERGEEPYPIPPIEEPWWLREDGESGESSSKDA